MEWRIIDLILRKHWSEKGCAPTQGIIAADTGIILTENQLRGRARKLKLHVQPGTRTRNRLAAEANPDKAPMRSSQAKECDALVLKYYAKYGAAKILTLTNYKRNYINSRARILGVKMSAKDKKAAAMLRTEAKKALAEEKWPVLSKLERLALVSKWRDRPRDLHEVML